MDAGPKSGQTHYQKGNALVAKCSDNETGKINLEILNDLLSGSLLHPIRNLKSIILSEIPEEQWDQTVNAIALPDLNILGKTIVEYRRITIQKDNDQANEIDNLKQEIRNLHTEMGKSEEEHKTGILKASQSMSSLNNELDRLRNSLIRIQNTCGISQTDSNNSIEKTEEQIMEAIKMKDERTEKLERSLNQVCSELGVSNDLRSDSQGVIQAEKASIALTDSVNQKNSEIKRLQDQLTSVRAKCNVAQPDSFESADDISSAITSKDKKIADLEKALSDIRAALRVTEENSEVTESIDQIKDKDSEIAELKAQISQLSSACGITTEIPEKGREASMEATNHITESIHEKDAEIAALKQAVSKLREAAGLPPDDAFVLTEVEASALELRPKENVQSLSATAAKSIQEKDAKIAALKQSLTELREATGLSSDDEFEITEAEANALNTVKGPTEKASSNKAQRMAQSIRERDNEIEQLTQSLKTLREVCGISEDSVASNDPKEVSSKVAESIKAKENENKQLKAELAELKVILSGSQEGEGQTIKERAVAQMNTIRAFTAGSNEILSIISSEKKIPDSPSADDAVEASSEITKFVKQAQESLFNLAKAHGQSISIADAGSIEEASKSIEKSVQAKDAKIAELKRSLIELRKAAGVSSDDEFVITETEAKALATIESSKQSDSDKTVSGSSKAAKIASSIEERDKEIEVLKKQLRKLREACGINEEDVKKGNEEGGTNIETGEAIMRSIKDKDEELAEMKTYLGDIMGVIGIRAEDIEGIEGSEGIEGVDERARNKIYANKISNEIKSRDSEIADLKKHLMALQSACGIEVTENKEEEAELRTQSHEERAKLVAESIAAKDSEIAELKKEIRELQRACGIEVREVENEEGKQPSNEERAKTISESIAAKDNEIAELKKEIRELQKSCGIEDESTEDGKQLSNEERAKTISESIAAKDNEIAELKEQLRSLQRACGIEVTEKEDGKELSNEERAKTIIESIESRDAQIGALKRSHAILRKSVGMSSDEELELREKEREALSLTTSESGDSECKESKQDDKAKGICERIEQKDGEIGRLKRKINELRLAVGLGRDEHYELNESEQRALDRVFMISGGESENDTLKEEGIDEIVDEIKDKDMIIRELRASLCSLQEAVGISTEDGKASFSGGSAGGESAVGGEGEAKGEGESKSGSIDIINKEKKGSNMVAAAIKDKDDRIRILERSIGGLEGMIGIECEIKDSTGIDRMMETAKSVIDDKNAEMIELKASLNALSSVVGLSEEQDSKSESKNTSTQIAESIKQKDIRIAQLEDSIEQLRNLLGIANPISTADELKFTTQQASNSIKLKDAEIAELKESMKQLHEVCSISDEEVILTDGEQMSENKKAASKVEESIKSKDAEISSLRSTIEQIRQAMGINEEFSIAIGAQDSAAESGKAKDYCQVASEKITGSARQKDAEIAELKASLTKLKETAGILDKNQSSDENVSESTNRIANSIEERDKEIEVLKEQLRKLREACGINEEDVKKGNEEGGTNIETGEAIMRSIKDKDEELAEMKTYLGDIMGVIGIRAEDIEGIEGSEGIEGVDERARNKIYANKISNEIKSRDSEIAQLQSSLAAIRTAVGIIEEDNTENNSGSSDNHEIEKRKSTNFITESIAAKDNEITELKKEIRELQRACGIEVREVENEEGKQLTNEERAKTISESIAAKDNEIAELKEQLRSLQRACGIEVTEKEDGKELSNEERAKTIIESIESKDAQIGALKRSMNELRRAVGIADDDNLELSEHEKSALSKMEGETNNEKPTDYLKNTKEQENSIAAAIESRDTEIAVLKSSLAQLRKALGLAEDDKLKLSEGEKKSIAGSEQSLACEETSQASQKIQQKDAQIAELKRSLALLRKAAGASSDDDLILTENEKNALESQKSSRSDETDKSKEESQEERATKIADSINSRDEEISLLKSELASLRSACGISSEEIQGENENEKLVCTGKLIHEQIAQKDAKIAKLKRSLAELRKAAGVSSDEELILTEKEAEAIANVETTKSEDQSSLEKESERKLSKITKSIEDKDSEIAVLKEQLKKLREACRIDDDDEDGNLDEKAREEGKEEGKDKGSRDIEKENKKNIKIGERIGREIQNRDSEIAELKKEIRELQRACGIEDESTEGDKLTNEERAKLVAESIAAKDSEIAELKKEIRELQKACGIEVTEKEDESTEGKQLTNEERAKTISESIAAKDNEIAELKEQLRSLQRACGIEEESTENDKLTNEERTKLVAESIESKDAQIGALKRSMNELRRAVGIADDDNLELSEREKSALSKMEANKKENLEGDEIQEQEERIREAIELRDGEMGQLKLSLNKLRNAVGIAGDDEETFRLNDRELRALEKQREKQSEKQKPESESENDRNDRDANKQHERVEEEVGNIRRMIVEKDAEIAALKLSMVEMRRAAGLIEDKSLELTEVEKSALEEIESYEEVTNEREERDLENDKSGDKVGDNKDGKDTKCGEKEVYGFRAGEGRRSVGRKSSSIAEAANQSESIVGAMQEKDAKIGALKRTIARLRAAAGLSVDSEMELSEAERKALQIAEEGKDETSTSSETEAEKGKGKGKDSDVDIGARSMNVALSVAAANSNFSEMRDIIESRDAEIGALKVAMKRVREIAGIEGGDSNLELNENEKSALEKMNERYSEEEHSDINSQVVGRYGTIQSINDKFNDQSNKIRDLEEKLAERNAKVATLKQALSQLRKASGLQEDEHLNLSEEESNAISNRETSEENSQKLINDISESIESRDAQIGALKQALTKLQTAAGLKADESLELTEREKNALEKQKAKEENEANGENCEEGMMLVIKETETKSEELSSAIEKRDATIAELKRQMSTLRSAMGLSEDSHLELTDSEKRALSNVSSSSDTVESKLTDRKEENSDNKHNIDEVSNAIKERDSTIAELKSTLSELQKALGLQSDEGEEKESQATKEGTETKSGTTETIETTETTEKCSRTNKLTEMIRAKDEEIAEQRRQLNKLREMCGIDEESVIGESRIGKSHMIGELIGAKIQSKDREISELKGELDILREASGVEEGRDREEKDGEGEGSDNRKNIVNKISESITERDATIGILKRSLSDLRKRVGLDDGEYLELSESERKAIEEYQKKKEGIDSSTKSDKISSFTSNCNEVSTLIEEKDAEINELKSALSSIMNSLKISQDSNETPLQSATSVTKLIEEKDNIISSLQEGLHQIGEASGISCSVVEELSSEEKSKSIKNSSVNISETIRAKDTEIEHLKNMLQELGSVVGVAAPIDDSSKIAEEIKKKDARIKLLEGAIDSLKKSLGVSDPIETEEEVTTVLTKATKSINLLKKKVNELKGSITQLRGSLGVTDDEIKHIEGEGISSDKKAFNIVTERINQKDEEIAKLKAALSEVTSAAGVTEEEGTPKNVAETIKQKNLENEELKGTIEEVRSLLGIKSDNQTIEDTIKNREVRIAQLERSFGQLCASLGITEKAETDEQTESATNEAAENIRSKDARIAELEAALAKLGEKMGISASIATSEDLNKVTEDASAHIDGMKSALCTLATAAGVEDASNVADSPETVRTISQKAANALKEEQAKRSSLESAIREIKEAAGAQSASAKSISDEIKKKDEMISKLKAENEEQAQKLTESASAIEGEHAEMFRKLAGIESDQEISAQDAFKQASDRLETMMKQLAQLKRRLKTKIEQEKAVTKMLIEAFPPLQKAITAQSTLQATTRTFILKYPLHVSQLCERAFNKPYMQIEHSVNELASRLDAFSKTVLTFIMSSQVRFSDTVKQQKVIQSLTDSYRQTLKAIFPSSQNLSPMSNPRDISRRIAKLQALMRSIFSFIPNVPMPKKPQIYPMALALRRILGSSSNDVAPDMSTDISLSDLSKAVSSDGGRFFFYEHQIKELTEHLRNSVAYEELARMLGQILEVEPMDASEETISALFEALRERIKETNDLNDQYTAYRQATHTLLRGLDGTLPATLSSLVQFLSEN